MRFRSVRQFVIALAAALVALAVGAVVALAAHPRPGVNLYGTTSWKGGSDPVSYVMLQVAPSGRLVTSMHVPSACGLTPPAVRRFAISSAGRFSGTRVVQDSGHGGEVTYTVHIAGTFTAATRAHGTYSLSFRYTSPGGDKTCHTGTQTWRANHVGSSN